MEQAIKRAESAGYLANCDDRGWCNYYEVLLDPLFWQALEKAEGKDGSNVPTRIGGTWWKWQMHRFIDHLADGGTPDEFFEKILTKQN